MSKEPESITATPELIRMAQEAKARHDEEQSGESCKHVPSDITKRKLRVTATCDKCGKSLLFVKGNRDLPTMWMAFVNPLGADKR